MALPDGLSEDDLKNGVVRITEPSEGIDMDAGEQTSATIDDLQFREVEAGDEVYYYCDLDLEIGGSVYEGFDGWSLNEGKVNENTGLGAFLTQLGYDLDEVRGGDFNLTDIVGDTFTFTPQEDEEGYLIVQRDDGGLPVIDGAGDVTTESASASDGDSGDSGGEEDSDDEGSDLESEVISIIAEHEGESESDVKRELAQTDGGYLPVFKKLKNDGTVEVDDDGEVHF